LRDDSWVGRTLVSCCAFSWTYWSSPFLRCEDQKCISLWLKAVITCEKENSLTLKEMVTLLHFFRYQEL